MAGTVAKLVYPHKVGPKGDGYHTNHTPKVMRNMEEDDILNQLSDSNFNRRADILEQLRSAARKNGGRLPFQDQKAIFRGFAMALADSDWDVRHQCIQLIHELIPHFGDDLDDCMGLILPRLVPNMGDSKITIRRSVIQTLHVYMKHTYDIQQTFRAIVQYGLENQQSRVKKEVIISLPMMFTPEFNGEDFFDIAQSLAKKLLDNSGDDSIQQHALLSLDKIRKLVGDPTFSSYLQKLSPPLRKYYIKLSGKGSDLPYSSSDNTRGDLSTFKPGDSVAFTQSIDNYTGPDQNIVGTRIHIPSGDKYEYGVIPSHIMDKLNDQSNFRSRAQAVEELKLLLRDMSDMNVHKMSPHVLSFITFLNSLLDDTNFKITTVTLEILGLLVQRQGPSMKNHLKPLVSALTKRMGDNKIVIRQVIMKVVMQLMQVLSAKYVLSEICENLSHRNSRVRQETLNIVIASLLTFPSYDFDLSELCETVAHTLVDPKRQVRQASLECYAVIASNLGAGKLQPLVSSVDAVELSFDGDGVMAAVQARLARRILPKLNADGLVDYATPVPTSAGSRGGSVNLPPGADIEWILSASGGTGGSARSIRSDMEIESIGPSARNTPLPYESPSHGPTPRRSAGLGKGRLPWEDSDSSLKQENGYSSQVTKHPRQKQVVAATPTSRDQSPDQGSYRQMFLQQKQKKQMSENTQPFSMYNPNKDDESHSALSTPRNIDDSSRMTFSSSWPDDPGKSNKRVLEPIADNEAEAVPDNSPIPTKPALARGTSSRSSSKRKVPPIPVSEKKSDKHEYELNDSARDSALDDGFDDLDAQDEMQQSLRQIRNSATRKKVDKIFEVLEKEHKKHQFSRSPSPPDEESGIYSSTTRSGKDELDHSKPAPSKKGPSSVLKSKRARYNVLPKIQSVQPTQSDAIHNKVKQKEALTSCPNSNSDESALFAKQRNYPKSNETVDERVDDVRYTNSEKPLTPQHHGANMYKEYSRYTDMASEFAAYKRQLLIDQDSMAIETFNEIPISNAVHNKAQKYENQYNVDEVEYITSDTMVPIQHVAPIKRDNSLDVRDVVRQSKAKTPLNRNDPLKMIESSRKESKYSKKDIFKKEVAMVSSSKNKNDDKSVKCMSPLIQAKGEKAKIKKNKASREQSMSEKTKVLSPKDVSTQLETVDKKMTTKPKQNSEATSSGKTYKDVKDSMEKKTQTGPKKSFFSTVSDKFKLSFSKKKTLPPIEKQPSVTTLHYTDDVVAYQSDNVLDHEVGRKSRLHGNGIYCQSAGEINTVQSTEHTQENSITAKYKASNLKNLEKYLIKEIKKLEKESDPNLRNLALSSLRQNLPNVLQSLSDSNSDLSDKENQTVDESLTYSSEEKIINDLEYDHISYQSIGEVSRPSIYEASGIIHNSNQYYDPQTDDSIPVVRDTNCGKTIRSVSDLDFCDCDLEDDVNQYAKKESLKPNKRKNVIIPRGTKALEIRRNNALKTIEKHDEREKKLVQNRHTSYINEESIFNTKRGFVPNNFQPRPPPAAAKKKKVTFPTRNYNNIISVYSKFNQPKNKYSIAKESSDTRSKTEPGINKVTGRRLYKTPRYLTESSDFEEKKNSNTKKTETAMTVFDAVPKRSFCTCLQNTDEEKLFEDNDAFSPYKRKNRVERYLNDDSRLPRYSQLYNMYRSGRVCVCVEHVYIPEEDVASNIFLKLDDKRYENVQARKLEMSNKITKVINGEVHDIVTKIKDGKQVKYLKKRIPGLNNHNTILQKRNILTESFSDPVTTKEQNCKSNPNGKEKNSKSDPDGKICHGNVQTTNGSKKKRIVVNVRETGVRVDLKSTINALKASCEAQIKQLEENSNENRATSPPLSRNFDSKDIYKPRNSLIASNLADLIESQSGEKIEENEELHKKKAENPFESKPRLVRKPTQQKSEREPVKPMKASGSNSSLLSSGSKAQLDFSPHGGVTFKENPGLSLQMIGTGFGDDSHPNEPKQQNSYATKARERRRVTKGLASSSSQSSISSSEDSNGVVGYRVFDGQAVPNDYQPANNIPTDRRERKLSRGPQDQEPAQSLGGVFGVGVRQNSIDKYDDNDFEPEEEDTKAIAISQATRATVQMKVQQKKEEAERAKVEREKQKLRELEEKRKKQEAEIQREKERQQIRLRGLIDNSEADVAGLAVSGSGSQQNQNGGPQSTSYSQPTPKPPANKPANTTPATKRKVKPVAEERAPTLGSAKSSSEPESPDNLKLFKEPQRAFDEAMKGLTQEEWDIKCAALNSIRRLAAHHSNVLINSNLHTLNLAMISEVKNLRSQVSRLAIICLGEMFQHLKRSMEPDMDQIATVLLAKAGESNNFIRDDTDKSLQCMIDCVTPQRAMLSLIAAGASHRNQAVRKTTSYFLVPVVEKMGPGRLLSGVKDVTDKILPVAANFIMDAQPETRHNGQRIFYMLMSHEDFDKVIQKHLPQTTQRNINDKLETLKKKGLSDPPTENGSAKKRGSGHGSRVNSSVRYHSATVSGGARDTTPNSSKFRSALPRTDEGTLEDIKSYCSLMTASDWRERQNGIVQMQNMVASNPAVVGAHIIKIFDKFVPCLKDSNSKVNLFALQVMESLAKNLADYMSSVISYTIQTVASNLSSKNKDIYESACNVLDTFMEVLDAAILLQPFCNQAQSGNSRIKPDMIERVAYLVTCVYPHRPRQVILHVLPLMWHLLGVVSQSGATQGGTGNIRLATNHLVHSVYSQMGDTLVENAKNNSNVTPRMMQCLQDMIDNPAPHGD